MATQICKKCGTKCESVDLDEEMTARTVNP